MYGQAWALLLRDLGKPGAAVESVSRWQVSLLTEGYFDVSHTEVQGMSCAGVCGNRPATRRMALGGDIQISYKSSLGACCVLSHVPGARTLVTVSDL